MTTTTPAVTTVTPTTPPTPPPFKLPEALPVPPPLTTLAHSMPFTPIPPLRRLARTWRLTKQIFGRMGNGTTLTLKLAGALPESTPPMPPFSPPVLTLPLVLNALRLAAHDPRVVHLHIRVEPLSCGWAKIFEVRRHLEYFAGSGKGVTVYLETGGPKEYFVGMGFALYVPPEAGLWLRGFLSGGTFVRGVLEKIGVEPQVERIGKYKSAGDQLARRDMAPEQREVIQAVLGDVHRVWSESVCEATGVDRGRLDAFVDRSPLDMEEYLETGLITGICYESDVLDAIKLRYKKGEKEEVLRSKMKAITAQKYVRRTSERLLALRGRKTIAVIRASGAITGGKSGNSPVTGGTLGSETMVELLRKVRNEKRFKACIIRCDSPGGSALASDVMWSEVKKLAQVKPVVVSMSDVAASGGYYLSMACEIVAEPLTVTGSVGVVTAKPSLGEFYKKIGYNKENISVGSRYAELLVDDRVFTEEEAQYYRDGALQAYQKFVKKAAESRGKTYEEMDEVAQGRVWTGLQAKEKGLVDHLGGLKKTIDIAKEKAGIEDEFVKLENVKPQMSFMERLGLGGATASTEQRVIAALEGPLAIAEVGGVEEGLAPLSKFVADAALAPFGGMIRTPGVVENVLNAVMATLK